MLWSALPRTWAKIEQPFEIRTADSVLFAIKRMLVEWKYNKHCIKVDTEARCLSVAGTDDNKGKGKGPQ